MSWCRQLHSVIWCVHAWLRPNSWYLLRSVRTLTGSQLCWSLVEGHTPSSWKLHRGKSWQKILVMSAASRCFGFWNLLSTTWRSDLDECSSVRSPKMRHRRNDHGFLNLSCTTSKERVLYHIVSNHGPWLCPCPLSKGMAPTSSVWIECTCSWRNNETVDKMVQALPM